jgi:hypothetical protein
MADRLPSRPVRLLRLLRHTFQLDHEPAYMPRVEAELRLAHLEAHAARIRARLRHQGGSDDAGTGTS